MSPNPNPLVLIFVCFPVGFFCNLAAMEAMNAATNKWDKALWKLAALFGAFLMGLSFVALLWRMPR